MAMQINATGVRITQYIGIPTESSSDTGIVVSMISSKNLVIA